MTLGIPPNVVMALLLGAFVMHGLQPGPLMMTQNPGLFWGIVASMYIGNVMLLILNLPLIGVWVQVLKVPYRILFPLILMFCLIGVYSISSSIFDISAFWTVLNSASGRSFVAAARRSVTSEISTS